MQKMTIQDLVEKLGPLTGCYVRKSKYLHGNQVVPYPDGMGFVVSPEVFKALQDLITTTKPRSSRG